MQINQPNIQRPKPIDNEHILRDIDLVVSKSNAEGDITYANPVFLKLSGYTQGDLLDKPHAILRHPDMPKAIFKFLWDNLKQENSVVAFVKNLCKDGSFYWVLATVKVAKNKDGSFRNYISTRKRVTDSAKITISKLYAQLLKIEHEDGDEASQKVLLDFLSEANIDNTEKFNNFMIELNKE